MTYAASENNDWGEVDIILNIGMNTNDWFGWINPQKLSYQVYLFISIHKWSGIIKYWDTCLFLGMFVLSVLGVKTKLKKVSNGYRGGVCSQHSPYSLRCLHSWQLHNYHTIWIGLANQIRLGSQDVWCCHGRHTVLETSSAVSTVCEEEGVLCLWLKACDKLLC